MVVSQSAGPIPMDRFCARYPAFMRYEMALLGFTAFLALLSAAHTILRKIRAVVDQATKVVAAVRRFWNVWRRVPVTPPATGRKSAKTRSPQARFQAAKDQSLKRSGPLEDRT